MRGAHGAGVPTATFQGSRAGGKAKGLGEGLRSSRAERGRARILKDGIPLSLCVHYLVSLPLGAGVVRRPPLSMPRKWMSALAKRHSVSLRGGFSPKK